MGWDYLAGVSLKDYLEVFRFLEGIGENHISDATLQSSFNNRMGLKQLSLESEISQ
jgi:hypothetical protein